MELRWETICREVVVRRQSFGGCSYWKNQLEELDNILYAERVDDMHILTSS